MSGISTSRLKAILRRLARAGRARPDSLYACNVVDELFRRGKYVAVIAALGLTPKGA